MSSTPLISIIIPCFNSGGFLLEALESCHQSSFQEFEILVVDDGSTHSETLAILNQVDGKNSVTVLKQPNSGAASARNLGVSHAKGELLLFLDSDNRIRPDYLAKAAQIFRKDSYVGVVYSRPFFFAEVANHESSRFEVRNFSLDSLLSGNYVDMCSLVRKKAFLEISGFDESRDIFFGEDWDLWIRMAQAGWKFHFLDEVLFDYRIRKGSLMDQIDIEKRELTLHYLGAKHGFFIHQRYRQYFRVLEKIQAKPFSFFLRILYYKYILRKSLLDR